MGFLLMNKQLTQKQNLDELMKQTLLNILSAKGIIYTYYDDILSSLHNFVKGGEFYPIKIKNNKLTKRNYANKTL
jgi:hypothetical protein